MTYAADATPPFCHGTRADLNVGYLFMDYGDRITVDYGDYVTVH